jgi:hypothetical protein
MKSHLFPGIATLLCALLASCYPYPEKADTKPTQMVQTPTTAEVKAKEEALRKKQEEELRQLQQNQTEGTTSLPQNPEQNTNTSPPVTPPRNDYPFANKVPGKVGFVFSPYNNKVVDVQSIPSGTLVMDPTYPAAEKKYFRVP